jgi:hypothetical protein
MAPSRVNPGQKIETDSPVPEPTEAPSLSSSRGLRRMMSFRAPHSASILLQPPTMEAGAGWKRSEAPATASRHSVLRPMSTACP